MPGPEAHRAEPDPSDVRSTLSAAQTTPPPGFVCLRDEGDDGTIRFALSGELDVAIAPELDQALRAAQQKAESVTLDLRRLGFMDCRGLSVIVAAAKRAGADGSGFRVVCGPPHVQRLFTLTESDRQIEIVNTG